MVVIDPTLEELRKIYKILLLSNSDKIEKELGKLVTSDERKKIWVLIDGTRSTKEIAKKVGVVVRSVNRFLDIGEKMGFVENEWGKPPRKIVDYTPSSWVDLFEKREKDGD